MDSTNKTSIDVKSLVILLLLFAVSGLFWLLVGFSSKHVQSKSSATEQGSPISETVHWRLVTTWPKNFPGLGSAPEYFANRVREMSGGRLNIDVYGAGELVPALGVFDAVSSGTVQAGHGAAYYWKGKNSATQFFTTIPFGMNVQEMNGWLQFGGGLELWRDIYQPFNVIPFAGGSTGVQMAGWFNREIKSLDDIKGLKMRIPGLGGEVWNRAGGTSVNIPGGEIYTSLQTGVIEATEWVGPYNDLAFGLQEVADYYYYPGWQEPGPMLEFIFNLDAYNALPEDLRSIVAAAARATNQNMLDEYTARNHAALQELKDRYQVSIQRLPDSVLSGLEKIAQQIYREEAARNPDFERVYQSYQSFQDSAAQYHSLSEAAYYQFRETASDSLH